MARRKIAFFLAVIIIMGSFTNLYANTPEGRILSIFRVDGDDATIARHTGGRTTTPRVGAGLASGNELTTGWDTFIYVQFDTDSIIKMDESSRVVVGTTRNRLTLSLQSGGVLVEVNQQAPIHSLETRIGNTAVSVRGTVFFMRRLAIDVVVITMLTGSGVVEFISDDGDVVEVPLDAGQMMWVYDALDPRAALATDVGFSAYRISVIEYGELSLFELVELYEMTGDSALIQYIETSTAEREVQRDVVYELETELVPVVRVTYADMPEEQVPEEPQPPVVPAQPNQDAGDGWLYFDYDGWMYDEWHWWAPDWRSPPWWEWEYAGGGWWIIPDTGEWIPR